MKRLPLALAVGVFLISASVAWCCTNQEAKYKSTTTFAPPGIQCPFGPCLTKTVLHIYSCQEDNGTDCHWTTGLVRAVYTPVHCLEDDCAYQVQTWLGPASYTEACPP